MQDAVACNIPVNKYTCHADHTRDAGTTANPKKKFKGKAGGPGSMRNSMSVLQKDMEMVLLIIMPLIR